MIDHDKDRDEPISELEVRKQRIKELERAEKVLADEIDKLSRLLAEKQIVIDSISEHVVYQDIDHSIISANKAAADSVGLSSDELKGRYCYEIWAGRDMPCSGCSISKAIETGSEHEEDSRTEDGRFWHLRGYPVKDETGKVIGAIEITKDVTARKRAEDALRLSEKRYRMLVETMNEGLGVLDADGILTYCNEAFARTMGYSSGDLIGQSALDYVHDSSKDRLAKEVSKRKKGERHGKYEVELIKKDGGLTPVTVSARGIYDEDGNYRGTFAVTTDITEQRQAAQALRENERRYFQLVQEANDLIYQTDANGNLTFVNPVAMRILGYSEDEILGKHYLDFFPPEHRDQAARFYGIQFVKKTSETYYEFPLITKQGGRVWLGQNTQLLSKGDRVVGFQSIARDITARKRVEEALREAKVAAESADRAKSQFLTNMSHELRTPLNSLIGFSEILVDQTFGELNDRQLRYANHVLNAGRHLLDLINGILDLSKVESGTMELDLSQVSVPKLMEESAAMIEPKAMKHGLELEFNTTEELTETRIQVDAVKLKQVMFNLLSNAVKFTPDGGRINVAARKDGQEIHISVSDTGVGIKPEDQERIFAAFEQVDASYSRKHQGTGLGLSLTRRLVELHGGRLWAESEGLGKGSTFTLMIPFVEDATSQHLSPT
jgi:PAS domain S-box-containing protein